MPEYSVIGKPTPMVDAPFKVTGSQNYVADMTLPRMLHAKVLRSPLPHARIARIDTSRAKKIPGVKAVLTGADAPSALWGSIIDDQTTLAVDRVLYTGHEVAAVAAVDEATALDALELIDVEYEPLPATLDMDRALEPDAPKVHEDGNLAARIELNRGDAEAGFRDADVVLEDTYRTSVVSQAYMEPVGALTQWDADGRLTVWMPCQAIFYARKKIAKAIGVPISNVRVIQSAVGGGFGGKYVDEPLAMIAALLAGEAGAPVRLLNTRLEEFQAGRPRVPMTIQLKMGIKKSGEIQAKECRIIADTGCYVGKCLGILGTGSMRMDNHYRQANLHTEGLLVYTHTTPKGAFRGYGNPQMGFAMEQHLDALAEAIDMDPAELRLKNSTQKGDTTVHGWRIESCEMDRCIRQVMEACGWEKKRTRKETGDRRRGIGIACAIHTSGARVYGDWDGACMDVKVNEDGGVGLICSEGDIGQGSKTVLAQIVAEELGIETREVAVSSADTDTSPYGFGAYASRLTMIGGHAARMAAEDARNQILDAAAEQLEVRPEDLQLKEGMVSVKNAPDRKISVADAVQSNLIRRNGQPIVGRGVYDAPNDFVLDKELYGNFAPGYEFTAQAVEVEVDTRTGQIEVLSIWAADDVGFVLNPLTADGQVHGAVIQGVGYSVTEGMIYAGGQPMNGSLADYSLPNAEFAPAVHSFLIESRDPIGPYGAKGCSEAPINPTAAATANAIYHAVGVRLKDLPMTAEKILKSL